MRFDIPVDPDADTAREWAREELAKHEYQAVGGTNWLQRFIEWVQNVTEQIGNGVGGSWGGWGGVGIAVAGTAVLGLAIWLVVGPMRRSRSRGGSEELGDPDLTADDLLRSALAAVDAEDWDGAVIAAYRALIRVLVERDVIDARPGMTAFEAALAAAAAIPTIATAVGVDADVFDAVRYGHLAATREHVDHVLATRATAVRARVEVTA